MSCRFFIHVVQKTLLVFLGFTSKFAEAHKKILMRAKNKFVREIQY